MGWTGLGWEGKSHGMKKNPWTIFWYIFKMAGLEKLASWQPSPFRGRGYQPLSKALMFILFTITSTPKTIKHANKNAKMS